MSFMAHTQSAYVHRGFILLSSPEHFIFGFLLFFVEISTYEFLMQM